MARAAEAKGVAMTYDDWRARGPHEDMPSSESLETCEHCHRAVRSEMRAYCIGHISRWEDRPEREADR